ncbi:lysine-rich arabinogalactan protein 19 isoform X2 [Drosophila mojavensis]|uniref:Uncharacterized protein, isoform B n=1 Tax=Drosophila mojavensis TaxID=7230 RepID=A0A0Q9WNE4_DROMO|nr:lysine-rich arabinogalactan protein 19 isoform X2 [Drosophila mojavensis]KRF94232.1 uncharacterized protein Dmoj_GI26072, isoform B [Drosophila mojavensis]
MTPPAANRRANQHPPRETPTPANVPEASPRKAPTPADIPEAPPRKIPSPADIPEAPPRETPSPAETAPIINDPEDNRSTSCTPPPFGGVTSAQTLSDDSGQGGDSGSHQGEGHNVRRRRHERAEDPAPQVPGTPECWVATPEGWLTEETRLPRDLVAHVALEMQQPAPKRIHYACTFNHCRYRVGRSRTGPPAIRRLDGEPTAGTPQ